MRDTLEVDVLIVGAGPAGLAAALRLAQLRKHQGGKPLSVAVLEKAREAGAHMLSGAVLDPVSLRELVPDYQQKGAPLAAAVREDRIYFLTRNRQIKFPFTPPPLRNHGHYVISLNRLVKWLAGLVEAEGVDLFTGFAGSELIFDGERVIGVRTGDRGVDKHGNHKGTYEPGVDIRAKVTILAEGVRGNLTKALDRRLTLSRGRQPQVYAIGIKELWEVPPGRIAAGTVIHTMGYPLRWEEFGGGFLYAMPENRLSVGFVVGLDYKDPLFDPHVAFQQFKQHPLVRGQLEGGQMVRYGAKALPEGGWYAIPRCYADGVLIAGDSAGFLNSLRLKGIHLAIKTGMLAADAAHEAVRAGDVSAARLKTFADLIDASDVRRELYPVRNVHQSFGHGLLAGLTYSGLALVTGGWWIGDPMRGHSGPDRMRTLGEYYGRSVEADLQAGVPNALGSALEWEIRRSPTVANTVTIDRRLTFDKLTNVHYSGTRHGEDQPAHLLVHTEVCHSICAAEYGNPCQRFCPANVYEIVDEGDGKTRRLHINASNCVHCKTCDIMDPYQVITWVPPEGGGGPQYDGM